MDDEIFINTYGNIVIKAILPAAFIVLKIKNADHTEPWINCPVFPYSCRSVLKKFNSTVYLFGAGRENFNYPVRSSMTAVIIQFALIAYNGNIRFHIVQFVVIEEDSERSRKHFTISTFGTYIISDYLC